MAGAQSVSASGGGGATSAEPCCVGAWEAVHKLHALLGDAAGMVGWASCTLWAATGALELNQF